MFLKELKDKFDASDLFHIWTIKKLNYNEYIRFIFGEIRRNIRTSNYMINEAKLVFYEYIDTNAPYMVNITSEQRKQITIKINELISLQYQLDHDIKNQLANLFKVDTTIFNEIQQEILKLMDTDSYYRFKQSNLYHEFLNELGVKIDANQINLNLTSKSILINKKKKEK